MQSDTYHQPKSSRKPVLRILAALTLLAALLVATGLLTRLFGGKVLTPVADELVELIAPTVVAPNSNAFDQLAGFLESKETLTIDYMLVTNQLLSVEGGVRATVVTRDPDRLEVRLLDGEHAGETVWVSTGQVR